MPLTQVIAISFIAPFVTILGSTLILKERLTWPRALAIALSMIGGFFISRPDKGIIGMDTNWYLLLPLIAASIFAFDKVLTRKLLRNGEKPNVLTVYLLAATATACAVPFAIKGFPWPPAHKLHWLLLLGLMGCAAHYSFSKAYAYAEVTLLMPFGLSKFVISAFVGYMAFGEIPRTLSMWIGILVILISIALLNYPTTARDRKTNGARLANQPTI